MRDACALEEILNCVPDDGDLLAEREPAEFDGCILRFVNPRRRYGTAHIVRQMNWRRLSEVKW